MSDPSKRKSKPSAAAMVRAIVDLGDMEALATLLDHGGDPNARNEDKSTLLMLTVMNENVEPAIVEKLLQSGAKVDVVNVYSETPLMCLAKSESYLEDAAMEKITNLLLEAGSPVDHEDYNGQTAVLLARDYGNYIVADTIEKAAEDHRIKAEEKARLAVENARHKVVADRQKDLRGLASKPKLGKPGM